ncbi:MAG TPA: hypothetical protein VEA80_16285 [Vitreimonas sp.]|uniref:hypothetical protein n=1 Tax=Vitreimonas sp. TaxID=3069702 RepID=UPI002D4743BC|nr:hypothetical protein [Vitreimonas sp.]HYD89036.1 hypothetical protein [Vitreimonas sp.]
MAGAAALFLINGLGDSGAFTEPPDTAMRSLRLAAFEGLEFGVRSMPFLSLAPAWAVFAARRWAPMIADVVAALIGAAIVFAFFVGWTVFYPLDPLLGGIAPLVLIVLLIGAAWTGLLIMLLRPRATPSRSAP